GGLGGVAAGRADRHRGVLTAAAIAEVGRAGVAVVDARGVVGAVVGEADAGAIAGVGRGAGVLGRVATRRARGLGRVRAGARDADVRGAGVGVRAARAAVVQVVGRALAEAVAAVGLIALARRRRAAGRAFRRGRVLAGAAEADVGG